MGTMERRVSSTPESTRSLSVSTKEFNNEDNFDDDDDDDDDDDAVVEDADADNNDNAGAETGPAPVIVETETLETEDMVTLDHNPPVATTESDTTVSLTAAAPAGNETTSLLRSGRFLVVVLSSVQP